MPLPQQIEAITFDCFGTLIDWNRGIGEILEHWAADQDVAASADKLTTEFAVAQRRHQAAKPFKSYRTVLHDAFLDLAADHGVDRTRESAAAFAASVPDWPAFDDTVAGLHTLKQGAALGVMSNVDNQSFARVHAERLDGQIDIIVTADDVETYKPDLALFRKMAGELEARGIDQRNWLHVAQSQFHDIAPCHKLGLACVWLDRVGDRPERGMTMATDELEPDLKVYTLDEVVAAVTARD
ncbi:MAG: HAD-IA family hydrolase [Pseudomonadota bacterium]